MSPISETTTELKHEMQKSLDIMRTLAEEIRLKLHLAGMDAKDEWRKLEPHIAAAERTGCELTEATRAAVAETVKRLSKLRASLS